MDNICLDNRFELINKYKQELIEATNIETSPEEMAVIDSILFRFWQMRWLDKLELVSAEHKGKWIPCSERLPKVGEVCLLTVHDIDWNETECDYVIIGTYNNNYKNHIMAWMPLPEPYKENINETIN